MTRERWPMALSPPSETSTPMASLPTLVSPPPVASPDAADVTMEGTPRLGKQTATIIFNPGIEDVHDAKLRVSLTGPVELLVPCLAMLDDVLNMKFFVDLPHQS